MILGNLPHIESMANHKKNEKSSNAIAISSGEKICFRVMRGEMKVVIKWRVVNRMKTFSSFGYGEGFKAKQKFNLRKKLF